MKMGTTCVAMGPIAPVAGEVAVLYALLACIKFILSCRIGSERPPGTEPEMYPPGEAF